LVDIPKFDVTHAGSKKKACTYALPDSDSEDDFGEDGRRDDDDGFWVGGGEDEEENRVHF
jgi:hypothetical protein